MNQNRKGDSDMPTRSSNMEPADGSRESVRESNDLGSSTDRAMFDERMRAGDEHESGDRSERGMGSSNARGESNTGGISNRPLDREECEQEQVPERGHSKSEG
jgi:hypothetical protein